MSVTERIIHLLNSGSSNEQRAKLWGVSWRFYELSIKQFTMAVDSSTDRSLEHFLALFLALFCPAFVLIALVWYIPRTLCNELPKWPALFFLVSNFILKNERRSCSFGYCPEFCFWSFNVSLMKLCESFVFRSKYKITFHAFVSLLFCFTRNKWVMQVILLLK